MIMKYLHDVSIRMAMLKTTIIKIELVCYSKNPAHNFNQYNKKRAFDAIINEQLLKLMELNNVNKNFIDDKYDINNSNVNMNFNEKDLE